MSRTAKKEIGQGGAVATEESFSAGVVKR